MCGIVGMFTYSTAGRVSEELIMLMRDAMVHRGPDDAGVYVSPDKKLGLGHRRLSIIDLSAAGRQPMSNEEGTIWITYNGEIYNHKALRKELEAKGHRYRSHTDTETIIHLYEEEGIQCLDKLEGMFAFALWDETKKQLFLARDRLGIKPLYYTQKAGVFIFASEIKAILKAPTVATAIDEEALYHYLTFSVVPAPQTLFKDIYKLPPGFFMVVNREGNYKREQYWDVGVGEETNIYPRDYYIERLKSFLCESIRRRMMSDVRFGVFLSGGLDSSINVSLMSRMVSEPINTFSVGIKGDDSHDEFEYARLVARRFNTSHHEILIDEDDFLKFFIQLSFYQDEPLADPVCVPLYYVSGLARENHTPVIQVGEGSDELFCGYENYYRARNRYYHYWRSARLLPATLRKMFYSVGSGIFLDNDTKKDYLRRLTQDEELFWGGAIAFNELEKKKLLSPQLLVRVEKNNSFKCVQHHYTKFDNENNTADFLKRLTYLELKHRLPELLLMRVDKMAMAHSIEARVPYLDHHLVEFAINIPAGLKIHERERKYILKEAAGDLSLPQEIIYRKKEGFCGSAQNMLTPRLSSFAYDLFCSQSKEMVRFFDIDSIKALFMQQSKQRKKSFKVWNLLNFGLWYRQWMQ